jgi:hypothetical protein
MRKTRISLTANQQRRRAEMMPPAALSSNWKLQCPSLVMSRHSANGSMQADPIPVIAAFGRLYPEIS